jgi:WD40 repeat protein
MAWSNDSRWLATAGDSRLVTIWDVARRTERDSLDDFSDRVTALAFHPDGRRLAVACQDQTLVIWDLKAESALPLAPRGGPYQQVSFSRDGGLLAAPAGDRVLIWDAETGKLVAELSTGGGVAQGPVFDSLGKALVAGGDDGTVWRWNNPGANRYRHEPDQTIRVGPARGLVRRVMWAPDDRHLVTLNGNGTAYVLRLADRVSAK